MKKTKLTQILRDLPKIENVNPVSGTQVFWLTVYSSFHCPNFPFVLHTFTRFWKSLTGHILRQNDNFRKSISFPYLKLSPLASALFFRRVSCSPVEFLPIGGWRKRSHGRATRLVNLRKVSGQKVCFLLLNPTVRLVTKITSRSPNSELSFQTENSKNLLSSPSSKSNSIGGNEVHILKQTILHHINYS